MKQSIGKVLVKDLYKDFRDQEDLGAWGWENKLNIRPSYQREFVYNEAKQRKVIETILKEGFLGVLQFVVNEDNKYEVLDGQQRILSIMRYLEGIFSYNGEYFEGIFDEQKNTILNTSLLVNFLTDTKEDEIVDWFETINIAGERLNDQELRNAAYTGPWLSHAKEIFSKTGGKSQNSSQGYLQGDPKRQLILEQALKWVSESQGLEIREYMSKHRYDPDANELWDYFEKVINWASTLLGGADSIKKTFINQDWGHLYLMHKDKQFIPSKLALQAQILAKDDEVQKNSGIISYLLSGQEKYLNLRAFKPNEMETKYQKQKGICPYCQKHFELDEMEGDHIISWIKGGKTTPDNLQMLCRECNRKKGKK